MVRSTHRDLDHTYRELSVARATLVQHDPNSQNSPQCAWLYVPWYVKALIHDKMKPTLLPQNHFVRLVKNSNNSPERPSWFHKG